MREEERKKDGIEKRRGEGKGTVHNHTVSGWCTYDDIYLINNDDLISFLYDQFTIFCVSFEIIENSRLKRSE